MLEREPGMKPRKITRTANFPFRSRQGLVEHRGDTLKVYTSMAESSPPTENSGKHTLR